MKRPVTNELYTYWRRLKCARAAPSDSEIDWVALSRLASQTFVIRKDAHQIYVIGHAGTRINALWRTEQGGQRFLDLWDEADRDAVQSAMACAIQSMAPIVAGVRAAPLDARPVDLELMLLPLRSLGSSDAPFLGSLALAEEPEWLGRAGLRQMKLFSFRVIREPERMAAPRLRRPAPTPGRPAPAVERPKLVVYKGGKAGA